MYSPTLIILGSLTLFLAVAVIILRRLVPGYAEGPPRAKRVFVANAGILALIAVFSISEALGLIDTTNIRLALGVIWVVVAFMWWRYIRTWSRMQREGTHQEPARRR